MLELIGAGAAGALAVYGHVKSRDFVVRRLRFTSLVDRPFLGIFAGVLATAVAWPLVGLLPVLGWGTAVLVGVGVGTGVALGARRARRREVMD